MPPARIAFLRQQPHQAQPSPWRSPGEVGPAHSDVVAAGPVIALPSPSGVKRARRTAKCQVGDGDLLPPVRDRLPRADAAPPLRLRRVRAEGTALDPPPAAPQLSRIHKWVLDHSHASAPKAAGHCRAEPTARQCPPGHAPSIRRTPMGCGKRPEHPDLGSHAAARPRPPIRTERRLCVHLRWSRRAIDADAPLHSVIAESRAAVSDASGDGPRRYGREVRRREPSAVPGNGIPLGHRSLL
jgi:hypothetical protein